VGMACFARGAAGQSGKGCAFAAEGASACVVIYPSGGGCSLAPVVACARHPPPFTRSYSDCFVVVANLVLLRCLFLVYRCKAGGSPCLAQPKPAA